MSDTPSTNAMLKVILETHGHVGFLNCPPTWVAFARELERELNAANQIAKKYEDRYFAANEHIKRLEEAGDVMAEWLEDMRNLGADACLSYAWREAKEDKL